MSNHSKRYYEEKRLMDEQTYARSLWKRLSGKTLNETQVQFLTECMTENLEHARHAENERLTFNSIFLALVAGAMAFADSLSSVIAFPIYVALAMAGFLSMLLTVRWNNTFNRHLYFAQKCYKMIHVSLFGNGELEDIAEHDGNDDNTESIHGLDDVPMYCFRIQPPIAYTRLGRLLYRPRTKSLYLGFYWIIQLLVISCAVIEFFKLMR